MVNLVQQREGEIAPRRLHQREPPRVHLATTPFTWVGLITSNRMLSPFEVSPVSTPSIAALRAIHRHRLVGAGPPPAPAVIWARP